MREIRSHTAMRGIAALLVIAHHYRQSLPEVLHPDQYTLFFKGAGSFVDFFFMLSGFVIAYVYLDRSASGSRVWIAYFRSRFARIYPLHFLTLLWMLALYLYAGNDSVQAITGQVLSNLTLIHAWGWHDAYALNFPSWSISGEFAAYLTFPVLALLLRKPKIWVAMLAIMSYLVIGLHEYLNNIADTRWERIALLRAVPAFCLGTILYTYRDLFSDLSARGLAWVQTVSAILVIVLLARDSSLVLLIPVFAALILCTYQDKGGLSEILSHPILHGLGLISYTIYMLHIPVRTTANYVWPKISGGLSEIWSEALFVVSCSVVTILLSILVFRFFEIPLRDRLRGR